MATQQARRTRRKRNPSPEKLAKAQQGRAELAALSRAVKVGMAMGHFPECVKVNDALLEVYGDRTGQHDFRKFREWKEAGFSVKKGESAFRVWAKPRKAKKKEAAATSEANKAKDEFDWFPICCLFHAGQVADEDGNRPDSCPLFILSETRLALPAPGESCHGKGVAA